MRNRRLWLIAVACLSWVAAVPSSALAGTIVFSSDRCAEGGEDPCGTHLWTVSDDGSALTRITPSASDPAGFGSDDDQPSWSPDGRIVYRRIFDAAPERRSLWTVSSDGSDPRPVGPSAPNDRYTSIDQPDWSPDGRWIAFLGAPAGLNQAGASAIWLMSADGLSVRQLTDGTGSDSSPTFSPDGRRIAFTRSAGASGGREARLLTMDLDGSDIAPVALGTPPRRDRLPGSESFSVSWSPDGQQIAFTRRDDVYIGRVDGTTLEYRGQTGTPFSQLVWSLEPTPGLILARAFEPTPLYRIELSDPSFAPRPITPQPSFDPFFGPAHVRSGDMDPDWRASAPFLAPPDVQPPLAIPLADDSPTGAATASRRLLAVRGASLRFLAADPSGVLGVSVTLGRRVPGSARRCRLLGRHRLGRARSCARSRWLRVRGQRDFSRRVRRLPPGRYLLRLRARDGLGNLKRRPRAFELRLRR